MMSFIPTGTPCNGPIGRPLLRHSSRSRACVSACSVSRWAKACTFGSTAAIRSRQARVYSSDDIAPRAISAAALVADSAVRLSSDNSASSALVAVEIVRKPECHSWPYIHEYHAQDHDQHVRHHAAEDLVERDVLRCDALEIECRHGHRWRQKCRLQIHEDQNTPQHGVNVEVLEQWQKDRNEDDDDLGPFQRPAQDKNDRLRQD